MKHALNIALALFFASFVAPTVVLAIDEVRHIGDASSLYSGSLVVVFIVTYLAFWWGPTPSGSLYDVLLIAPFVYLPVVASFVGSNEPVYRVALALAGVIAFVPALGATAVGGRLNSRLSRISQESVVWYSRRSPRRRRLMWVSGGWVTFGGFIAVAAFGRIYPSTGTVTAEGIAFGTPFYLVGFALFAISYASGIHRANESGFVVEYPARSRFYGWDSVKGVSLEEDSDSLHIDCGIVGISCDTADFDAEEVIQFLEEQTEVETG